MNHSVKIYQNLWAKALNRPAPHIFQHTGQHLATYRGVQVIHNPAGSYDYVLAGAAIGQRAGFDREKYKAVIDAYLDGSVTVCAEVADHIRQFGHTPAAYELIS